MTAVSVSYIVLLYLASAVFLAGLAWKIVVYARTPQPFRIPTTPAPTTYPGVIWRLIKEVFLFASLFKANKWTWLFGWIFHVALVLALLHHIHILIRPIGPLEALASYAGVLLAIGLGGLWARRLFVDRVRYISTPSDHLMLALFAALVLSGLGMRYLAAYPDILAMRAFMYGLIAFNWEPLPEQPLILIHLGFFALLLIVFPMSKLLHAPGVFFSPTRNQRDLSRTR